MTIKVHGMAAIRAGVDHGLDLAEHAERVLKESPDFEVVTPASLAVVGFAFRCDDPERVHPAMIEALVDDGHAMVSSTLLGGRSVLRLCTINPRTTFADIDSTIAVLAKLGASSISKG
jgi:glutamate/tyrosine decarboxylase-like PLP-dependent enzyme